MGHFLVFRLQCEEGLTRDDPSDVLFRGEDQLVRCQSELGVAELHRGMADPGEIDPEAPFELLENRVPREFHS